VLHYCEIDPTFKTIDIVANPEIPTSSADVYIYKEFNINTALTWHQ
jgi:hypothetical protein